MTIQLETHGNAPAAVLDREWNEPDGIGPRGTLILLVGRGENGDVYNRFGSRIAADAYRVRTVAVMRNSSRWCKVDFEGDATGISP